jgi:uncharacterized protein Usg
MSHLKLQLLGHRLTTAEIIYRMPDHPHILQSFVWQDYDVAPQYPVLHRFLKFWETNLDGALHLVRVASAALVRPAEFRFARGELRLH